MLCIVPIKWKVFTSFLTLSKCYVLGAQGSAGPRGIQGRPGCKGKLNYYMHLLLHLLKTYKLYKSNFVLGFCS